MYSLDLLAEDLAEKLSALADQRGFFPLPEHASRRGKLERLITACVSELVSVGILTYQDSEKAELQEVLLKLHREAPAPQECRIRRILREQGPLDFPQEACVSHANLDRLTLCSACALSAEGLRGTHYVEALNRIRIVVAEHLRDRGHVVPEGAAAPTRARSVWPRYEEWKCLAESNGENEHVVSESMRTALDSRIAS